MCWALLFYSGEEDGEKDSKPSVGEGGDAGELVPGKSLVFAAMELLVFILVRHLPQLNSRVNDSPSHAPLRPQRLPEESARLVANAVSILAELPSLCSPAGKATNNNKHTHTQTPWKSFIHLDYYNHVWPDLFHLCSNSVSLYVFCVIMSRYVLFIIINTVVFNMKRSLTISFLLCRMHDHPTYSPLPNNGGAEGNCSEGW